MTHSNYLLFMGAAFMICIVPGPDLLYVIANGIGKGSKGGVVASLGLAVGMLIHTIGVVLGVSILISEVPIILQIIKITGAIYLLYIGYLTYKGAKSKVKFHQGNTEVSLFEIFKRAIITNLLNPKVAIFFLAFLPQFVSENGKNVQKQLLVFGLLFLLIGLLVDGLVGFISGQVKEIIAKNNQAIFRLNMFSSGVFIALGLFQFLELLH